MKNRGGRISLDYPPMGNNSVSCERYEGNSHEYDERVFLAMKRYFLFLVFCFAVNILSAQEEDYDWGIKASPFSIFLGDYITNSWAASVAVEKRFNERFSFQQEVGYIFKEPGNRGDYIFILTDQTRGIKLDSEIRRYIERKKQPLEGFYLAGNVRNVFTVAKFNLDQSDEYSVRRFLMQPNLGIGWQDISANSSFVFDVTLGGGVRYITSSFTPDHFTPVLTHGDCGNKKGYRQGSCVSLWYKFDIKMGYLFK